MMKNFTTIGILEHRRLKEFVADHRELYTRWLEEQEAKEHD